MTLTGDLNLEFQLTERKQHLLHLCVVWDQAMASLPPCATLPSWGPPLTELEEWRQELGTELVVQDGDEAEEDIPIMDIDEEEELDMGLIEHIETLRIGVELSDTE